MTGTGDARDAARRAGGLWVRLLGHRRDAEQRLLAQARAGRAGAFDRLRARHEAAVEDFCRMMLEQRSDEADGVVAETFAVARRELASAPRDIVPRAWLIALAYERCVARLDDEDPGTRIATGQGEEADQRRGAALVLGSFPDAEVASVIALAATRPALFGLAGEMARNAPHVIGEFAAEFAAEQAAVDAVGALADTVGGGETGAAAQETARRAATTGVVRPAGGSESAWRGADRARRVTAAALTGSVAVVAGAGVYAVADSQRSGDGGGSARIVAPGSAGGGQSAVGTRLPGAAGGTVTTVLDSATGGRSGGRSGRDRSRVLRLPGSRGGGRGGRDGATGSQGVAGAQGAAGAPGQVIRDPGRFLPGGGGGGSSSGSGSGGPGGQTPPRQQPLVSVDARVGPARARVEIPGSDEP